jgi:hypothetical protein
MKNYLQISLLLILSFLTHAFSFAQEKQFTAQMSAFSSDTIVTLSYSSTLMDFGTIAIGDSTRDSIFITNNDSNIINIHSIFSDNEHFWISHSSLALNPSETKTLYVSFSPDTVSSFSGKIIFEHDSSDSPDTVIVMANGVSSAISFSAVSIDFENVA